MTLKRKKKKSRVSKIIITTILSIILAFNAISYVNKKITPYLLDYASLETQKIANLIINKAITKQVITDNVEVDKLFTIVQDSSGNIQSIDFNSIVVNDILSSISDLIQDNLIAVEQGKIDIIKDSENIFSEYDKRKLKKGIIYEVPLLAYTGNTFLANIGPKIPVRLNLVGNVSSNIDTKIEPYGINNALLEILIHVEVSEQIILPIASKKITIDNDIPIAIKMIQGSVPRYYQNGITNSSPIFSLPLE
ncbi:MAG: sporulation protein YunB [Bacilli bacterium]